jgi:hypothetical protein
VTIAEAVTAIGEDLLVDDVVFDDQYLRRVRLLHSESRLPGRLHGSPVAFGGVGGKGGSMP